VAFVIVVVAAVLPAFIRARTTPASNACVNNLRYIDGATQQWALENHKTTNDVPSWEDVRPYLSRDGKIPTCPHGGTYTLGRLDKPPTCSYPGHSLL
jgi:hypothetical protein